MTARQPARSRLQDWPVSASRPQADGSQKPMTLENGRRSPWPVNEEARMEGERLHPTTPGIGRRWGQLTGPKRQKTPGIPGFSTYRMRYEDHALTAELRRQVVGIPGSSQGV